MSPERDLLTARYIRLSGETADQSVLDGLREAFPEAKIDHAYASTEAGVGFVVEDGHAGFPISMLTNPRPGVEMKVLDGTLRIRSRSGAAVRYLGSQSPVISDPDGFIDSGDIVENRGDRLHFIGRRDGIINIGGLKVHPEEVEAVINAHPSVRLSLVKARKNPFTGALVVADVLLQQRDWESDELKRDIAEFCSARLDRHKVPVLIRFVGELGLGPAGKIRRF